MVRLLSEMQLPKEQLVGFCGIQQTFQSGVFCAVEEAGRLASKRDFVGKFFRSAVKIAGQAILRVLLEIGDFGVVGDR